MYQSQPLLTAFELVLETPQFIRGGGAMAGCTQGVQGALMPTGSRAQFIYYVVHTCVLQG